MNYRGKLIFAISALFFSWVLKAQNEGARYFMPLGAAPLNLAVETKPVTGNERQDERPTKKSLLREFDEQHIQDRMHKMDNAASTGCGNLNFETGDFTGWQGFTGCNPNAGKDCNGWPIMCCQGVGATPGCCATASLAANIFSIVSTGIDPYGLFPVNAPALPGYTPGKYSCRLGNDSAAGKAQRLITTFTPSVSNASFTYQYAAVLENPKPTATNVHTPAEMPFFKAFLLDQAGDTITCTNLNFIAGAPGLNFQYSNVLGPDGAQDVQFQSWVTVSTDLTSYIGTPVTITFTTADCALSGHFGYAYINCECIPLEIAQQDTLCTPFKATLTAPFQDNTTYAWTGPGGPYSGSAIQVNQGGNYNLTMTSTSGCIVNIAHFVIAAQALKDSAFEVSQAICKNNGIAMVTASGGTGALTYSWSTGSSSATVTSLSGATYTVTVTDSRSCSLTSVATITLIPPPSLTATGSGNLNCFTPSVLLTGTSSGSLINWFGGALSNAPNPATVSAPGKYTVIATNSNGCQAIDSVAVKNSDPTVSVQSVLGSCIGKAQGAIVLTSTGGGLTYSWNNGDVTKAISGLKPGNYVVTVKDSLGCTVSDSATVVQYNPFVTMNTVAEPILNGESIQLSAGGGISYLWGPSGSLNDPHIDNPIASPGASTEYTVTVTDQNSCTAMDSVWVDVLNIFIPSAFSPNGDGENDVFYVRGLNGSVGLYFAIYDRWGERVFETTDLANGWDGMFRGKLMDSAVFAWYLKVSFPNGKRVTKTGNLTLLR